MVLAQVRTTALLNAQKKLALQNHGKLHNARQANGTQDRTLIMRLIIEWFLRVEIEIGSRKNYILGMKDKHFQEGLKEELLPCPHDWVRLSFNILS